MRRGVLDSALTEVGTVRDLLGRTERVRMVVVMKKCGSKRSVPISELCTLKFCWGWDMAYGKGCCAVLSVREDHVPSRLHHLTGRQFAL